MNKNREYVLSKHINENHIGQLFPLFCYFCASNFKTFDDLESHSQTAFDVEKEYFSCQLCGEPKYKPRYINLSNLLQHIDRDHKNYVKNMCTFKHGALVVSPIITVSQNFQKSLIQERKKKLILDISEIMQPLSSYTYLPIISRT